MDTIRIMLVEDHQIVREGLRRMLELSPDMLVVAEASSGEEALGKLVEVSPDIVITDIKMPGMDGIELTRSVKSTYPLCKVLVLTLYEEYLTPAVEAGAAGYLQKDLRRDELISAIRSVRDGRSPIHMSMDSGNLARLVSDSQEGLSGRERAVLSLVARGLTNKDIAEQLSFSETTVKRVIRKVLDKMGVSNRSEAVAQAIRDNLI